MSTLTGCIPSNVLFLIKTILDYRVAERYNNTELRPYHMKGVIFMAGKGQKRKDKDRKEAQVANDTFERIKAEARNGTINEIFDLWCQIKCGLKNNTFEIYKYMYRLFVRPNFGKRRISTLKKSERSSGIPMDTLIFPPR